MTWFGRKDKPLEALPREFMVMRDLMGYFRANGWEFIDALSATAWTCGFMAGNILVTGGLSAESKKGKELIRAVQNAVAEGIKAHLEPEDPELLQSFLAAGGQL